jgi:hypothetical protein
MEGVFFSLTVWVCYGLWLPKSRQMNAFDHCSKPAISFPLHAVPSLQLLQGGDGESAGWCLEAILLGLAGLAALLLLGSQALVQLLAPHAHLPLGGVAVLLLASFSLTSFSLALHLGLWLGTGLMQLQAGGELQLDLLGLDGLGRTSEERWEAALQAAMRWDSLRGVDMACNLFIGQLN